MSAAVDDGHGRNATSPSGLPVEGWKDIIWRVWTRIGTDHISLIAAGASFYLLLALFPALAAFVSLYGFFADPTAVADQVDNLASILPAAGVEIIGGELQRLADQSAGALTIGFFTGLAVALWSANAGLKTLFEAMNVAYGEREKRSFIRLNLETLGATVGAMLVAVLFIIAIGVVPAVLAYAGLGSIAEWLIDILRWPVLLLVAGGAINLLYRYGPSRRPAKWRWVTWGSAFAAVVWVVVSLLFSWYLGNFANYGATYGSLGAVVGLLMWTWVSVMVLIVGAEIDAEMEHQTARDSTVGPEKPMGERGAVMADTLGEVRTKSAAAKKRVRDPGRAAGTAEKPGLPAIR